MPPLSIIAVPYFTTAYDEEKAIRKAQSITDLNWLIVKREDHL